MREQYACEIFSAIVEYSACYFEVKMYLSQHIFDQLGSTDGEVPETLAHIVLLSSLDMKYDSTVAAQRQMD